MNKMIRFLLLCSAALFFTTACNQNNMQSSAHKKAQKGKMIFQSSPSGAKISIQGKMIGVTPRTTNPVYPGMYIVKFEKEGYQTQWRPVTVEPGKDTLTEIKFKPITSAAMITSTPRGAQIIKNGKTVGITPCILTGLQTGLHKVRLQLSGTVPQEISWEVNSDRPFTAHAKMIANTGRLRITSEPKDAKIFIDGEEKGLTPFNETLEQGDHEIKVTKYGFEPYITNIHLKRNETRNLNALLKIQPMQLVITSKPAGAMIRINGKDYGLTPYTFQTNIPGSYTVQIMKDHFGSEERKISLEPGNPYKLDFELSSEMGALEFVTEPANVEVFIDGKKYGKTEADPHNPNLSKTFRVNDLLQGVHTVEIVHKRGTPPRVRRKFTIRKQQTTRLAKTLKIWVPNVVLVHKRGWRVTGRVRDMKQDPIILESKQGVSSGYPKSDILRLEIIKDGD
ncbi:MAG: PEGA domain-containing protein [Lentisphaeria bacterium]|nr:PEGA domain-containing protein [Lentisphaeria bacterium]